MLRVFTLLLLILAGVGAYLYADIQKYITTPVNHAEEMISINVDRGMPFSTVAALLETKGLIREPLYWKLFARFKQQTQKIKSGEYQIRGDLSPEEILSLLVSGETIRYQLTVIEGNRFNDFWEEIQANEKVKKTIPSVPILLSKLGIEQENPEGLFLPETYSYSADTTDLELFQRSYRFMQEYLDKVWQDREADLPLNNAYEALILASIVEKETGAAHERPLIAGVFVNRLRKGMRLQTDPTIIYGMGDAFDGNLRKKDLLRDNPYNTYTRYGLPPTPICLPGREAIDAVLHPEKTDKLYFVSKGDGTHYFSKTYREHQNAVIKYQLKR